MPLALLLVGLLLCVSGIKGTEHELAKQIEADLTGSNGNAGFLTWFGAIMMLGFAGYIPGIQQPARYMIILIVVVMVLKSDSGVFDKLVSAIGEATQAGPAPAVDLPAGGTGGTGAASQPAKTSDSGGGIFGALEKVAGLATTVAGIL